MDNRSYAPLIWDRFRLDWGRKTWIMGIVNVTPDSFSGDGLATIADSDTWVARVVEQGARQVAEGADIIDVGGASSRPGAVAPTVAEELSRVVPAIEALSRTVPAHVPISIDTTHAEVASAALVAGAHLINDITGLRGDPALASVAARVGVPLVVMANMRGVERHDVMSDVTRYLAGSIELALAAGVAWDHLIIDPGFGFGNSPEQNIALIRHLGDLRALGRPILLGVSRKSTLGTILGDAPVADRLEASLAAAVAGVLHGAQCVRVHDVRATARALRVADAIQHGVA